MLLWEGSGLFPGGKGGPAQEGCCCLVLGTRCFLPAPVVFFLSGSRPAPANWLAEAATPRQHCDLGDTTAAWRTGTPLGLPLFSRLLSHRRLRPPSTLPSCWPPLQAPRPVFLSFKCEEK